MGSTRGRIKTWFDELAEVVGWLVLGSSTALVAAGRIGGMEYAGLAGLAVVTLVGGRRYKGISVGPLTVSGESQTADAPGSDEEAS